MWRAPLSSCSIRSLWGQKLRSGHRNLNNRKPSQPMGKLFLDPMESTIKSVVKSLAASQHPLSLKAFVCFSGPWRHSAGASRDRRPRDRIQLSRLWFVVVSKTCFFIFSLFATLIYRHTDVPSTQTYAEGERKKCCMVHSSLHTEYTVNFHVFLYILFKPQRSMYWKCSNSFELIILCFAMLTNKKYLEATHQDVETIPLQVAKWLHLKMRWRLRSQKHAETIKGEWPEWPMMHWRRSLSKCMFFLTDGYFW